jgi:maleate cis-trans isomerase
MAFTGRIGLLAPSSNTTVEAEFFRILPAGVTVHTARLPITQVTPNEVGAMVNALEMEAKLLATADVDVIILGATAPSFLKGLGHDLEMIKRIEDATGKPATTTSTALIEAMRALNITRMALGSAFTPAVNTLCANFIEANGIKVVARDGLNLEDNLQIGRLDVQTAYDLGKKIDCPEAQCVALACTNWKSVDIIERLERDIGKPVLSTSQVSIWGALKKIGYTDRIEGYGRLLRTFAGNSEKAAA